MEVKVATHVGQVRENNEDSFWVGEHCLLVCDGMGGHQGGEIAAKLAVDVIKTYPFSGDNCQKEVRLAIEEAHKKILATAEDQGELRGMGTTATLACISRKEARLVVGHVGDSRGYLYVDGELSQITVDHSVVGELVRAGTITAREAKNHTQRHVLTQALGTTGEIEIEMNVKNIKSGTIILLCTDGLTDVVTDQQIGQILAQADRYENTAQALVDLANSLGGPDNITVVVAQIK